MAGGGTGGHLFPGLAVAREFQKRDTMTHILFVGTESGIESRVLPREKFPLEILPVKGIKGRGLRGLMEALWGVPMSLYDSLRIISRFRPDCILGLGGYASGPLVVAGKMKGVPCAILEQNLRPGLTNRILARVVDRIFTTFEESVSYLPSSKIIQTGNPVRWERLPKISKGEDFTLLIFGGSAGAHKINLCAIDALDKLKELAPEIRVIHQTGEADFAAIKAAYSSLPFRVEIFPFIDKMDEAYARADLIICRAGATTIAELTNFGKAAILVPYPYAAHDHQRLNAQALKNRGAAEMVLDQELGGDNLASRIRSLFHDRETVKAMGEAARGLSRPEAAKRIVNECYALVQR